MDGMSPPEHIMALVIIVVVESHEGIFLLSRQCLIDRLLISADTGMIHLGLFRILDKQHTTDQTVEAVADPEAVLVALALEAVAYLLLRVILRLEVVEAITAGDKEVFTDIRGMHAEETVEHPVVDERTGKEVLTERESEILDLAHRHRQSRREVTQEAEEGIVGYLPDTEEAENMVDADGVEILFHPTQATMEPLDQGWSPVI